MPKAMADQLVEILAWAGVKRVFGIVDDGFSLRR
jgi:hypothetical protein